MKKSAALLLAILMTAALAVPCAAGVPPKTRNYTGFSDLPEESWCAEAVRLCYETGLLSGKSETTFSPSGPLTYAQLIVLSARLHHILKGGDGILPQAPEGYGAVTITRADGTPAPFQKKDFIMYGSIRQPDGSYLPVLSLPEELAADSVGETFQMTIQLEESRSYTGTMACYYPYVGNPNASQEAKERREYHLTISLDSGEDDRVLFNDLEAPCLADYPVWTRNAVYYMVKHGLDLTSGDFFTKDLFSVNAQRRHFAAQLNDCLSSEDLPVLNSISEVPDRTRTAEILPVISDPLRLYEAGILTGTDAYGTFRGRRGLTRGEAAVMLARTLDPAQRVRFTPQTPDWYLDYTLEKLPDSYQEAVYKHSVYTWSDLTAVSNDQGGLTYLHTNGQPVRDLSPSFPGCVYLQAEHERIPDLEPLPNAGDAYAHGYDLALQAPYVDGAAPFFADQGYAWGYYDQSGKILIPARFLWCGALVEGTAIVMGPDEAYYRLTVKD